MTIETTSNPAEKSTEKLNTVESTAKQLSAQQKADIGTMVDTKMSMLNTSLENGISAMISHFIDTYTTTKEKADTGPIISFVKERYTTMKNEGLGLNPLKDKNIQVIIRDVKKFKLGSSQVYCTITTSDGKSEDWFLNSEPDDHGQYLYPYYSKNAVKNTGTPDLDVSDLARIRDPFVYETTRGRGFFLDENTITKTNVFTKARDKNNHEKIVLEPYQFYTEYALSKGYPGFYTIDGLITTLGINKAEDILQSKLSFIIGGDGTYKVRKNGKTTDIQLTEEQYYICQATKYRLEKKLGAYDGNMKNMLQSPYVYVPLQKTL